MVRILFAFSWGNYPLFHHYPNRPDDIMVYSPENSAAMNAWFHTLTGDYGKDKCFNIYNVFLFAMKNAGILV